MVRDTNNKLDFCHLLA